VDSVVSSLGAAGLSSKKLALNEVAEEGGLAGSWKLGRGTCCCGLVFCDFHVGRPKSQIISEQLLN
jgi:hypothetical protein